jgi:hypothetical protein
MRQPALTGFRIFRLRRRNEFCIVPGAYLH